MKHEFIGDPPAMIRCKVCGWPRSMDEHDVPPKIEPKHLKRKPQDGPRDPHLEAEYEGRHY